MERADHYAKLNLETWDKHWKGGNNKYPPIEVLNVDEFDQREKLELLLAIFEEREKVCDFLRQDYHYGPGAEEALASLKGSDKAAIFIPSGGKNAKWIWRKKESKAEWWWVRMAQLGVPVFLLVSPDDFDAYAVGYHGDCPVYTIGYDGFGIGCGRAASVRLLVRQQICGIITDDRTGYVECDGQRVESLEQFATMIACSDKGLFCSVLPKLKCNIFTIVRGDKAVKGKRLGMFCFPALLMSSKEDLTLALMIEAYDVLTGEGDFSERNDLYSIIVHTDTNNPVYVNADVAYEGRKKTVLESCCRSTFFRDSKDNALALANWKHTYNFKNLWDAIKMQESAIFGIMSDLGPIGEENAELFLAILYRFFWVDR
jgi:hypothetical protein